MEPGSHFLRRWGPFARRAPSLAFDVAWLRCSPDERRSFRCSALPGARSLFRTTGAPVSQEVIMNALARGAHQATIRGAKLAYHVHGEGPLLVALPGGPGFSHDYLRSPLLESRATVIYVDPIGTGDSSRLDSPSEYGRARDVSDLEDLRMHLGLER